MYRAEHERSRLVSRLRRQVDKQLPPVESAHPTIGHECGLQTARLRIRIRSVFEILMPSRENVSTRMKTDADFRAKKVQILAHASPGLTPRIPRTVYRYF